MVGAVCVRRGGVRTGVRHDNCSAEIGVCANGK